MAEFSKLESVFNLSMSSRRKTRQNDFVVIENYKIIDDFSPALLKTSGSLLGNGQDLFILHYPGPGSMVLTRMDCRGSYPASIGDFIHHTCAPILEAPVLQYLMGNSTWLACIKKAGVAMIQTRITRELGIYCIDRKSQINRGCNGNSKQPTKE